MKWSTNEKVDKTLQDYAQRVIDTEDDKERFAVALGYIGAACTLYRGEPLLNNYICILAQLALFPLDIK